MPMMFNDRIEGVFEIASLHEITEMQREYLQKAAETVAAALNNITNQEQMSRLLLKAQEGSDQLHAQEEELRQNMEELEATHEEMNRKQKAYETILANHGIDIQAEIDNLKS
jgi:hypothetical protein